MSYETPVGQLGASVPVDCDAPALTGQAVLWVVSRRSAAPRRSDRIAGRLNPMGHHLSRRKVRAFLEDCSGAYLERTGVLQRRCCDALMGLAITITEFF